MAKSCQCNTGTSTNGCKFSFVINNNNKQQATNNKQQTNWQYFQVYLFTTSFVTSLSHNHYLHLNVALATWDNFLLCSWTWFLLLMLMVLNFVLSLILSFWTTAWQLSLEKTLFLAVVENLAMGLNGKELCGPWFN